MQQWACWGAGVTGVGLLHSGGRYYNVNGWKSAWMCVRKLVASRCAGVQRVEVQLMEGCCVHGCRSVWAAEAQGCETVETKIQVDAGAQVCWSAKAQGCRDTRMQVDAGVQGRGAGSQGSGCEDGVCKGCGVGTEAGWLACWIVDWLADARCVLGCWVASCRAAAGGSSGVQDCRVAGGWLAGVHNSHPYGMYGN